jgi:predicted transcriptional regulator
MKKPELRWMSRRERQVLDTLYALGSASAADVMEAMADPPSYSAVRTHLRILTDKGLVRFTKDGARYVYEPVVEKENAAKATLGQVVQTFFKGSVTDAVVTLVSENETDLTEEELDRLAALIDKARRREK